VQYSSAAFSPLTRLLFPQFGHLEFESNSYGRCLL